MLPWLRPYRPALLLGGVALLFTNLSIAHPLVMLLSVVLASVLFSLAGFVNAVYAKKFDDISIVPTFILTPLTYLGGVFYSVSLLPAWAEKLSYANPILYMVNAFRYGFLGTSDVDIMRAFLVTAGAAVTMFAVVVTLMNRGTGIRE